MSFRLECGVRMHITLGFPGKWAATADDPDQDLSTPQRDLLVGLNEQHAFG